jgi:hypothetical protein
MTTATAATRHRTPPRRAALDHALAMRLAAAEYDRFTGQLRDLAPDDWTRPTACPAWDVHAIACHVLGMAELAASPAEQARQFRAAKRAEGPFLDALTAPARGPRTGPSATSPTSSSPGTPGCTARISPPPAMVAAGHGRPRAMPGG